MDINKIKYLITLFIIFIFSCLFLIYKINILNNELKILKSSMFLEEELKVEFKAEKLKYDKYEKNEKKIIKNYNAKFNIEFKKNETTIKNIKKIIRNISNKYKLKILLIKEESDLWLLKIIDSKINKKNIKKILFKFSFPKDIKIC